MSRVVVFDYGSGNVRSAVRALEHVGAEVELTGDRATALAADGLFVPGVGNFHACLAGLRAADGPVVIDLRLAGGRPVLGVCVGMQVLFDGSDEPSGAPQEGLGEWPGSVSRLQAEVVPHMGWSDVESPPARPSSQASSPSGSTSSTRMPCRPGRWRSPRRLRRRRTQGHLGRPRRPVRRRRRERPPRRRPSSTPRSPAMPACPCSRTG